MPYIKAADWREIKEKLNDFDKLKQAAANQANTLREPERTPAPTPKQDNFAGLKEAIAQDAKEFDANTIAQALMNDVCFPLNCREEAFIMEEGRAVRAQPFRFTDGTYKVVSQEMLDQILKETQVDAIEWQSESYDCEDIARKFVTRCVDLGVNSIGRVMSWSGSHAFCIAVIRDGDAIKFVFIEPQTDQYVEAGAGKYSLENALIVIS